MTTAEFNTASLLNDICEALKKAAEALLSGVQEMPPASAEIAQASYIATQAKSVANVAVDVELLARSKRFQNVVGLCRIGFESRINLYAAMRVPDFAAHKFLAQAQEHIKELEDLIQETGPVPALQSALATHRKHLDDMRITFGGLATRKWKIYEAAKEAGLLQDYKKHYSLLSKAAHNTPTGLASKDDPAVLASSLLRLLHDTIETLACLTFFEFNDGGPPQPLPKNWRELLPVLQTLQQRHSQLEQDFDHLTGGQ